MWFAQALTIISMVFGIWSFQGKTQKQIIFFQHICNVFATVGYFLLGGYVGAMLCILAIFRNLIFSLRAKYKWCDSKFWIVFFITMYAFSYASSFLFLGKEAITYNFIVELLPALGSSAHTFAFRSKNAKLVRLISLIAGPFWLAYNILVFSIGGILNEGFILVSIIVGYFRLDREKKTPKLE